MATLPPRHDHLQVNFCKTVGCENFACSDEERYVIQYLNPQRPAIVCKKCGAFPPLLSNQLIHDEWRRLRKHESDGLPACRNIECKNLGLSIYHHKHLYHAFGYSGERQRYRCKACQSTFVDKWSGENKKLDIQEQLLALLFTGYSVQEICSKLGINPKTFYDHINQIASRCRKKQALFDMRWFGQVDQYQLATHHQALQPQSHNGVQWLVTAEPQSGYVVSQHVSYDEADVSVTQDFDAHISEPFTPNRYVESSFLADIGKSSQHDNLTVRERIDTKYQNILARNNVEDPLGNYHQLHHPKKGRLVFPPYTSYAHFYNLKLQCDPKKPLIMYLTQEPLLRSAVISVYQDRINDHSMHLLYVDEPYLWNKHQSHGKIDIVHMGWWQDRWAISSQTHRDSNLNIEKGICYIAGPTSDPDYWLSHASINAVHKYQAKFQAHFASFINEPRRKARPAGIIPLLDIFRAWNNLCSQNKQGKTPAMKQGLIHHPLSLRQLLA